MTAVLNLHPTPGHPAAVVAAVHEALDTLQLDDLAPDQYADTIVDAARARTRLHALELKLVAAAEKAAVPRDSGARSTGAWLAKKARKGQAESARDARLAQELDEGLPATGSALDEGEVSPAHAAVIAEAIRKLPKGLTPDQVAEVEARLVERARTVDPHSLRRIARRALEAVERDRKRVDAHEDDQLRDEEGRARAKTRLTWHDNGDGTLTGHFTVPLLAGAILRKVIQQLASPRRSRPGATAAQGGDQPAPDAERFDWARRNGEAFATLLEHLPTDRLTGKVGATVVVTLDAETLRGQLRAAGLDTGDLVSSSEARRLACQAGLVPAVLGGASQVLDLGRSQRFFTEAHRTAGAIHHRSCAAEGCDMPYAWCELHHRQPWSTGGRTDLREMEPLCSFHHRRIHDPGHHHRRLPDGSIRFARRT